MNATLKDALRSGEAEALQPPAILRADIDWLATLIGSEPELGQTVAIGVISPAVYKIAQGEGVWGVDRNTHLILHLVSA